MAGVVDFLKFFFYSRRRQLRGPRDVNCKEATRIMTDSADALMRMIRSLLPDEKTKRLPPP